MNDEWADWFESLSPEDQQDYIDDLKYEAQREHQLWLKEHQHIFKPYEPEIMGARLSHPGSARFYRCICGEPGFGIPKD